MALRNLPGIRGLFSLFQHALTSATSRNRVKLSAAVHLFLTDFKHIVNQLHTCPARFRELVPTPPTFIGACDASGHGMGGVWFPPSSSKLLTDHNPTGTLTNSDFELAATIAHQDILTYAHHTAELTTSRGCDNLATVAWQHKGSSTTTSAHAYLLRLASFYQWQHQYHQQIHFIPGIHNTMADTASRSFHLSDSDFLTHFNSHFSQPTSWKFFLHIPPPRPSPSILPR